MTVCAVASGEFVIMDIQDHADCDVIDLRVFLFCSTFSSCGKLTMSLYDADCCDRLENILSSFHDAHYS